MATSAYTSLYKHIRYKHKYVYDVRANRFCIFYAIMLSMPWHSNDEKEEKNSFCRFIVFCFFLVFFLMLLHYIRKRRRKAET